MEFRRYRINKILNNNAVVITQDRKDVIVMYPGIGFKNKVGNYISLKSEYSVFKLQSKTLQNKFETLINEIPYECIELTQRIIELAKKELNKEFNQGLLISLSDHIHFAINNYDKGYNVGLASEEIKRFYHEEYKVGLKALDMIEKYYHICLSKVEASSIAFHLINSQYGNSHTTTTILNSIDKILNIIETSLNIKLEEDSLNYSRLVIHLKFFIQRLLNGVKDETVLDKELLQSVKVNKNIQKAIDHIKEYLFEEFHYDLSQEEKFYLLIHIARNV